MYRHKPKRAMNPFTWEELAAIGPRRMLSTARSAVADPFLAKLERVRVPSLIIRGERDAVAPMEWVRLVQARLREAPLQVLPGRAHTVVFSGPRQLAGLITEFAECTVAREVDDGDGTEHSTGGASGP